MANRHSHKTLRAEIRARMASTGATYQQAREAVLSTPRAVGAPAPRESPATDLILVECFGRTVTIATVERGGMHLMSFMPTPRVGGARPWFRFLSPRGAN